MRKFRHVLIALAASGVCAGKAVAAEPTSPVQRAEMIRLINGLESKPYGTDADNARKVVMAWLTEAPDVTVNVCGALLGGIDELEGQKDDPGLLLQLMFAEARFILEHPEQAGDEKAVHAAGVDGVLAFYAAMKAEKPGVKIAPIEKIAKAKADGKLPAFTEKAIKKCN